MTGITIADFVSFRRKLEFYVRQMAEKNDDQNLNISLTTYGNSIDRPILQLFGIGGWFPVSSLEDVTEEHIEACVS